MRYKMLILELPGRCGNIAKTFRDFDVMITLSILLYPGGKEACVWQRRDGCREGL